MNNKSLIVGGHAQDGSLRMLSEYSSRFRVFRSQILLHPEKVVKVIKSVCALHNWIRKTKKATNSTVDVETHFTGKIIPGSSRENKSGTKT